MKYKAITADDMAALETYRDGIQELADNVNDESDVFTYFSQTLYHLDAAIRLLQKDRKEAV